MTGNLPDLIDKFNHMQEQYLRGVEPVKKSSKKKQSIKLNDEIPLSDCIITEINSEGELKGFRIRPELVKVIMMKQ